MKLHKSLFRVLSVFLMLCMLTSMLPTTALAATIGSGYCGDNLRWTMSDRYTLTISGTGAMDDFAYGRAPWGDYLIQSVIIQEGVTSIGSYAFYAESLYSIQIPNSVTSIGYSAFKNCNNLSYLTIGNGLTTIGNEAFRNCNGLRSVTIPDSVTSIGNYAFSDCTSITSVTIGNAVTSIGNYAFNNCTSMTSVTIGNAVTRIGDYAFSYCSGLTGVTIPTSVVNIGDSAFYRCFGLTNITIPSSVKSVGEWAFHACYGVTDIIIEDGVTSIGSDAFSNCNNLTSVAIPDSVTSIGDHAFHECGKLANVIIPEGVTSIEENTFTYCSSLTSITIPGSVKNIDKSAFYGCRSLSAVWYNGMEEQWKEITVGSYNAPLTGANVLCWNIDEEGTLTISGTGPMMSYDSYQQYPWYSRSASVKKIVIHSGITTIANHAFRNCSYLQAITISDSVTSIGEWTFYGCFSLKDVYYTGTQAQWNEIIIGSNNSYLTNATLHIIKPVLTGITVNTLPADTEYWVGEELDTTGLTLTAIYSNGSTEEVTEGFTLSGFDSTTAGTKTVTVTYESFTVTFDVTVAICDHLDIENGYCANCSKAIGSILTDREGSKQLFATFAEALEAAVAGQTVIMTGDTEVTDLLLPRGVALDLNGYTLTVDSVMTYSGNSIIDTSVDVSGLLKITDADGNMISKDNAQLPVYDSEAGGYRFFAIDVVPCAVTGGNKYWFKIKAEKFAPLYDLINAGADVQIKVKMTWDGQMEDAYAAADLSFTKSWADRYNENEDIYITVTVNEADGVENFKLIPIVTSAGVEIPGEEM